nr:membrane protein [Penicillium meliponae]
MPAVTASGLLGPVIVLNAWSLAMEVWMYATMIPALRKAKVTNTATKSQVDAVMPAQVRWKRDNYNHLMEQPTQFYAVALTLALLRGGQNEGNEVLLAWLYTGTRIVHSLVHTTSNVLMVRFALFVTSSTLLGVMTVKAGMLFLEYVVNLNWYHPYVCITGTYYYIQFIADVILNIEDFNVFTLN